MDAVVPQNAMSSSMLQYGLNRMREIKERMPMMNIDADEDDDEDGESLKDER